MFSNYLISILPVVVHSCGSHSFKALLLAGSTVGEAFIIRTYFTTCQPKNLDSLETRILSSSFGKLYYNFIFMIC